MRGNQKRCVLLFLIMIIMLPFLSADTQNLNNQYTLLVSSNSSNCNLSYIQYPDSSISIMDLAMTKNGQIFNLLINSNNFTQIGQTCYFYTCDTVNSKCNQVTPYGINFNLQVVIIYILFLSICLWLIYLSGLLISNNSMENDKIDHAKSYALSKENKFQFYLEILKRKLWIVGLFGVYLFALLFVTLSTQLIYGLGLTDLYLIFSNLSILMMYGAIPLVIFCIGYIIIHFYTSITESLRYQYGSIGGRK